jgi:D-3-phosphoglycerate dehydrogenase
VAGDTVSPEQDRTPTPKQILIWESISPVEQVRSRFETAGVRTTVIPRREDRQGRISREEFLGAAEGCDAAMGLSGVDLTAEVFDRLPRLRYVSKIGIGYENIDVDAAAERGVLVTNTPAPLEIIAVAEHTIALMLACLKRLDVYNLQRLREVWRPDSGVMAQVLSSRTVGIVGFGRIGRAVASRLQGWNVRIIVHDRLAVEATPGIEQVPLEVLLREADVVTVHANADSNMDAPLLDRERLSLMKPTAVLINTARGVLVDQQHLTSMLGDGSLLAAGLDVFHPQPPGLDEPLLGSTNLIATPHSAAWSPAVGEAIEGLAVENALAMLQGLIPEHVVNRRESHDMGLNPDMRSRADAI